MTCEQREELRIAANGVVGAVAVAAVAIMAKATTTTTTATCTFACATYARNVVVA